ncbi:MAG: ATP-binding protein [Syntrophales bacterium]|nr:ATP-binding protein [Syntrophales bacterium]
MNRAIEIFMQKVKQSKLSIPAWALIASAALLVLLFTIILVRDIKRQEALTAKLLIEKGEAIIRSLEAGARTGIGLKWGAFELQKLLMETAQQPGVDYIIITSADGTILADSEPALIGDIYEPGFDLKTTINENITYWRRIPNVNGADTFEVYRRFITYPKLQRETPPSERIEGYFIFVGLDTSPVVASRSIETKRAILTVTFLCLAGFAGITAIFLAERYRGAKRSITRMQAFSDHLMEQMPAGLIAVNAEGKIVFFNKMAEKITGKKATQTIGKSPSEVLHPLFVEYLTKKGEDTLEEVEFSAEPGRKVFLEITRSLWNDGQETGRLLLFRDVTEMRKLHEEIARNRQLAALGNLAAGVAHEIRNPLSSIKGFATYFRERYQHTPNDAEIAELMLSEVNRLNRVITQLLDLARPPQIIRRRVDMKGLIEESLRLVEERLREKNISLNFDLEEGLFAFIDPDHIRQVFLNVLINAIDALSDGGTLEVKSQSNERGITVIVKDTGSGIKKEDLNRVFDPYFTTKPSGVGLGLAIASRIMESHGGSIRLESEERKGTCVFLHLPHTIDERKSI